MSDRLDQLAENLALLREQLGGMEQTIIEAPDEEKTRLKQRKQRLQKEIGGYEQEYWQILAQASQSTDLPEPEAEVIVAEIVECTQSLQTSDERTEILEWLQKIYDVVSQPTPSAAAKVKAIISTIPPFIGVAVEPELDVEKFLQNNLPTFRAWAGKLRPKK